MNLKELKEIIDFVTAKESIEELEIEKSGVRLRIKRASSNHAPSVSAMAVESSATRAIASPTVPAQLTAETENLFYIKSPFVGTFYKAPSPQADPYCAPGDIVEKGTVVCIIEA